MQRLLDVWHTAIYYLEREKDILLKDFPKKFTQSLLIISRKWTHLADSPGPTSNKHFFPKELLESLQSNISWLNKKII